MTDGAQPAPGDDDAPDELDPSVLDREIPLHALLGLEITDDADDAPRAEVTMPVRPQAFGFTANLHGGAIATLVDLSCALAAARASGLDPLRQSLVTADMHVRYLGRPRTDTVVARAEVVKKGSQLIVVECRVLDTDGHVIAVADFSMMLVTLRKPLRAGIPVEPGAPEL